MYKTTDGFNVDITEGLKEVLRQNPKRTVKKAVIERKRSDTGDLVQKLDSNDKPMWKDATIDTHPNVYFDASGRPYFNVFRTILDENEREILVTNPKIKTSSDCALYARGEVIDRKEIPGSELWDNGSDVSMKHTEPILKGVAETKIVKVMTAQEVLDFKIKPTGTNIVAQIANLSDDDKKALKTYLAENED